MTLRIMVEIPYETEILFTVSCRAEEKGISTSQGSALMRPDQNKFMSSFIIKIVLQTFKAEDK